MKRILTQKSLDYVKRTFGDIKYLENSRVFYTILLLEKANEQQNKNNLHVLIKNQNTPSISKDWEMFSFLRCVCSTLMTSGLIVREENNTSSLEFKEFFDREDWKNLYFSQSDKKNLYIMSKITEKDHLKNLSVFQQPHLRTLLTITDQLEEQIKNDKEMQLLLKEKDIILAPRVKDLSESIKYLKNRSIHEKILVENGVSTVEPLLQISDPMFQSLDFITISVYRGQMGQQFYGNKHPSIDSLKKLYKLVHVSEEFPSYQGTVQFYNFTHKNLNFN